MDAAKVYARRLEELAALIRRAVNAEERERVAIELERIAGLA